MVFGRPEKIFVVLLFLSLLAGIWIFLHPHYTLLRSYGGDVAAVASLYFIIALITKRAAVTRNLTLGIAIIIELAQAFFTTAPNTFTNLLIGHTFDVIDVGIYSITVILLAIFHRRIMRHPAA